MDYCIKVEKGKRLRLDHVDASDHGGMAREEGEARAQKQGEEMAQLLDLLFAAGKNSLLLVLQGRDTGGKDGLIRHLLSYCNAQSCSVVPFKAPSTLELSHDFLWRIHKEAPGKGSIAIFNRSHYEDVLIVRVHDLVPESVWRKRYEHINNFEKQLCDDNTILLKFYLHISKDEQERRLLDREKDPTKAWKLAVGDWKERELWDKYTEAYEDALSECNTSYAPWHIVPANHKWYRNLAVTDCIVDKLKAYREGWMECLEAMAKSAKEELRVFRAQSAKNGK